jgi:hypothetical protein
MNGFAGESMYEGLNRCFVFIPSWYGMYCVDCTILVYMVSIRTCRGYVCGVTVCTVVCTTYSVS